MRIYIVRHADPDYANHTITRQGHLEAHALARRFEDYNIDTIVCSPLGRAQDTARYTAKALELPVTTEQWLSELDLCLSVEDRRGIAAWNVPGDRLRANAQQGHVANWDLPPELQDSRITKALESVTVSSDRFFRLLGYERQGNRYKVRGVNPQQIAVFCHNGLGLTWLSHILSIPTHLMWSTFWLPPSSVSTLLFEEHESGWATPRCTCMGDTSHLSAMGLPVQTGGLTMNQY
jgi:broad specificity phosphatase PhoE